MSKFKPLKRQRVTEFQISTHATERGIVERDTAILGSPPRKTPSPVKPSFDPPVVMRPTVLGSSYELKLSSGEIVLERMPDETRTSSGKTQKAYMKDWLAKRSPYLDRILSQKAGPKEKSCQRCVLGRGTWRCLDCLGSPTLCVLCCRDVHQRLLFHRIEKWNGKFYQRAALWQVGVKIHLGHGGNPCEISTPHKDPMVRPQAVEHSQVLLTRLAQELHEKPEVILETLSTAIDNHTILGPSQDILDRVADAMGQEPLDVVRDLVHAIHEAEAVAAKTAADATMALDEADAQYVGEQDLPETATSDIPIIGDLEEDDAWEDAEVYDEQKAIPRLLPRPPNSDGAGNPYVTVVDTSGFHHLPLVHCRCPGKQDSVDAQLLDLKLYPASTERIQTLFTFAVLDDHRLENLECKTSSYQYHQKLRRRTLPAFPNYVVNRYPELRRVSRQWRNLKLRKWFGVGGSPDLERGSMALFCAACPQPGVNLPPEWPAQQEEDPALFMRNLVADGNFKADHLQSASGDGDVSLTSGEGFMTNSERYQAHLNVAVESKQIPTCHRHRAQLNSDATHNGCDCTGVGGHACARHGCFAPGSLVDFQKGERQANMDWSLCEALATTGMGGLKRVLHIYDIGCQYHQHLGDRIRRNPYLAFPDNFEIVRAIGLFHVHGHVDECLYRYATSYVPGAGSVDGEILETLWAVLNTVSRSTRTATLAHRRELLDDHMGDSNFKKLVNIVSTIVGKYKRALQESHESERYFSEMDKAAPQKHKLDWQDEIEDAENLRQANIDAMDIMLPRIRRGPTLKEVEAKLATQAAAALVNQPFSALESETHRNLVPSDNTTTQARPVPSNTDRLALHAWLVSGFKIEDEQIDLRQHVRRLSRNMTVDQKLDLARKRQRLAARIQTFHMDGRKFLGDQIIFDLSQTANFNRDPDGNISDGELPDAPAQRPMDIEYNTLVFPSTASKSGPVNHLYLETETDLRTGRANDALQGVRETLGYLSFEYITKVRTATSTSQSLRSQDGIHLLTRTLSFHRRIYNQSQRIITMLDPGLSTRYPPLLASECKISTAISDTNAPGQSQARLAWFWGALDGYIEADAQSLGADDNRMTEFYRIHWLRARAQRNRWKEELKLTSHEMEWTTRFFMHQASQWVLRRNEAQIQDRIGMAAYSEQQISMWNELGRIADLRFKITRNSYTRIWAVIE